MADAKDLMARYCSGEASAFRELHAAVSPRLYGYLVKLVRQRTLADDLLQQTWLKVHRARATYVQGADPLPWIYSIAHRTFIDEARKAKRAIVRVDAQGELPEIAADLHGTTADRRDEPRADPALVQQTLAALAELPAPQREAVVLTKLDGKSVAEAADIAGVSVGAMKVRAHRGYERLRALLGVRKPAAAKEPA